MTIVEFLLARIAEDEAIARETAASSDLLNWADDELGIDGPAGGPQGSTTIVLSPERLLAECEAKRRIIDASRHAETEGGSAEIVMFDGWSQVGVPSVLASLALPYADHPDFDPAWRP